jgi:hypothetical protein
MNKKEFLEAEKIGDSVRITPKLDIPDYNDIHDKDFQHRHVSWDLLTDKISDIFGRVILPSISALEQDYNGLKALGYKSIPPVLLPEAKNIRFFDNAGMIWRYGDELSGDEYIPRVDILMVK